LIKCLWQTEFHINPSLKKSETIGDYNFDVRNGDTFVNCKYETDSYDTYVLDMNNEYEYIEQTLARKHASNIRDLMLERMIFQKIFRPIKIEIISRPKLLNEEELANAGLLKNRNVRKSLSGRYHILDVGDSLKESHNFWQSGFKNKISGFEPEILRIADWFQRAGIDTDMINSFIFTWVGFNGLYGLFNSIDNNNTGKFEHMIDKLLNKTICDRIILDHSNILDKLQSYNIISEKGKTWSDDLKKERENNADSVQIIKSALNCIYGVRNQVFHEAPSPTDINERVKNCKLILVPIATICLKNFVTYV